MEAGYHRTNRNVDYCTQRDISCYLYFNSGNAKTQFSTVTTKAKEPQKKKVNSRWYDISHLHL